MSFKMDIKKNGKFENKSPNFKAMEINEEVKVKPLEVLKEGTASKGDRSWTWTLFKMEVNGEECAGFAPANFIADMFKENFGNELILTKEIYKDKNDNDKIGFKIKEGTSSSSFEFKTEDLKDEEGTYTDKEGIELIKEKGHFDNVDAYIKMWTGFGSTEERAREVFANRNKV